MNGDFIEETIIKNINVCDELIDFFNNSSYAKEKKVIGKTNRGVVKEDKDSIDLFINQNKCMDFSCTREYLDYLRTSCEDYIEKYEYADGYGSWALYGFNIQYYPPGGGFKRWHTERISNKHPYVSRHLVFQTFLNDIDDGGGTEFFYQNKKITPKKGKTIIWPADWTHTHRGIISHTEEKYIVTGWFNYI